MGCDRMEVVKRHLKEMLSAMEGIRGAAFGIALFDQECHLPLGTELTPASWTGVKNGLRVVEALQPGGGNGGEAACMNALAAMRPQAIFFLGDGGWSEQELIQAA
eukprot:SAG31_NODE_15422_length_756_cov_0.931507_1_plen_104_part_01